MTRKGSEVQILYRPPSRVHIEWIALAVGLTCTAAAFLIGGDAARIGRECDPLVVPIGLQAYVLTGRRRHSQHSCDDRSVPLRTVLPIHFGAVRITHHGDQVTPIGLVVAAREP